MVFTGVFAQHTHNGLGCGSDQVNEQYFLNHPEAAAQKNAFDAQLAQMSKLGKKFTTLNAQELYEIPIVVHIIHDGEAVGVGSNKSDQQIIDWVNYTNAVYAGTAPGMVGENNGGTKIPVKLVLAKRTPDCMPTNGIVRVNASSLPQYSTYGLASNSDFGVSEETIRNLSRWNPDAYYNVYLVKTITGNIGNTPLQIGGYAYFPSSGNDIYGTFMRASTAQIGDVTFPHEVAHSLGIYHTFQGTDSVGDACPPAETDCYLEGDMLCDTEMIKSMASTYPIPSNSAINPCTNTNYANTQYNIMGYGSVNDRFTPQQTDRAVAQLLQFRSGLLNSLGATAVDENAPVIALAPMCVPTIATSPSNFFVGPTNVTFGTINVFSQSTATGVSNYSNYSDSCLLFGSTTIPGYEASNLSVSITGSNPQNIRAYIDWNNDGVFDEATETVLGSSVGNSVNPQGEILTVSIQVTPPVYAVKNAALRLRVIADFISTTITPCMTPQYGQVEDYAVIVEESSLGCDGISAEITAELSAESGILGSQYNLSATGVIGTVGIQYQWQSSTTGTDSWSDIASATSNLYTATAAGANGTVTFYRLKVTCTETEVATFSDVVSFEINPEYCPAGSTSSSPDMKISNVTFANINNNSTAINGYEDFSAITATVQAGETYSFSASSTGTTYYYNEIFVYIDKNYDGDFDDDGELVFQTTGLSPWNGSITIPSDISLGKKRMRIRLNYNDSSSTFISNNTPCGNSTFGQVEDYSINIIDLGCNGISDTIVASINNPNGAPGTTFNLSATGVTGLDGIGYQWQKSNDGTSDWQDIQDATALNTTQTATGEIGSTTYYRLKVTCSETQVVTFSNAVSYEITIDYCAATGLETNYERIGNVTFAGINNNSTSPAGYEDFSSIVGNVQAGETYTFTSTSNASDSGDQMLVWIDFNNNGSFEDIGELVLIDSGQSPWNGSIAIPANASLGNRRMRIRVFYVGADPSPSPCGDSPYGQVEDYTVLISASETIWNGTAWSNGLPNENKNAVIIGALTMNTDLVAKDLKVTSTGAVTISSGTNFTVNGSLTNEGQAINFVVENGGNLIQLSDAANTGAITVKRNSNLMVRNDNTMWSSPVIGQSLRNFSNETLYNRFWTYNEATNLFSSIFADAAQDANFVTGLGYSIRVRNSLAQGQSTIHEGVYTGVPFNGNLNVPVVNTGSALEDKGYNSIGNPYPSSITVVGANGFLAVNPGVEALYFWTHQFPVLPQGGYAGSNYASYTALNSDELGAISTGQGFIIKTAATGNVVFNNAMRTTLAPVVFNADESNPTEKHRLWLKLSNATQMVSKTLIGYMTGATNGFDAQIDGKLIDHTNTTLYNVLDNEKYAIQGRALPFQTSDVVSLGFKLTEIGQYSIAIESKDGLFAQGQSVYLKDNQSNTIHNLSDEPFTFDGVAGEFNNRFEVLYENIVLDAAEFTAENVLVYQREQTIFVNSPQENLKSVVLHDVLGRVLYQNDSVNNTTFKIATASFGNQVLILQVKTASGMVITKKLINK